MNKNSILHVLCDTMFSYKICLFSMRYVVLSFAYGHFRTIFVDFIERFLCRYYGYFKGIKVVVYLERRLLCSSGIVITAAVP